MSETSTLTRALEPRGSVWLALGLALAFLALVLPGLGRNRLLDVDELTHARVAADAARQGRWLPLYKEGKAWSEKPPLMVWLAARTLRATAQPEFSMRLWPCLFAGLALFAAARLGALLAGSAWGGLFAGLLLAGQPDFILHARFFSMDSGLLACLLMALLHLALAFERSRLSHIPGPGGLLPAGLWLGLAAWIKSWFCLALFPPLLLALWVSRPWPFTLGQLARRLILPPLLGLGAWLALYAWVLGPAFLAEEWGVNLWGRIQGRTAMAVAGSSNLDYYLAWALAMAPACAALFPALGWLATRKLPGSRPSAQRLLTWALAFGILLWAFGLLAVRSQSLNYLLPLEALVSVALGAWLAAGQDPRAAWALLLSAALSAWAALLRPEPGPAQGTALVLGLALGAWVLLRPGQGEAARWAQILPRILAGLLLLAQPWLGSQALLKPPDPNRELVAAVQANPARTPGEALVVVGAETQAVAFYSQYIPRFIPDLPRERPAEALVVLERGGARFFPAQKAPSPGPAEP